VFAAREAVMLGTLGENTGEGVACEAALTGEGEDDALVALMRKLFGSRLDDLDMQSDDLLSQLPR